MQLASFLGLFKNLEKRLVPRVVIKIGEKGLVSTVRVCA